jgi:hypothetical protein
MGEMVVVLGVIVATFGTLVGLLIAFRKWLAIRERIIAEMFPDESAPVEALKRAESLRPRPAQKGESTGIAA